MKLEKYIFLVLLTSFLFSCSNDDEIKNNPQVSPVEVYDYDAYLSLAVRHKDVPTKASTPSLSLVNSPERIKKLSLAVFSYESEKLMAFKEIEAKENESLSQVMDVKVASGTVKLLLIANYDDIPKEWYNPNPTNVDTKGIGLTTIDDFLNELSPTTLNKELNGYLTMSSGVLNFNLRAGYNFIGCSQTTGDVIIDGKEGVELLGQELYYKSFVSKLQLHRTISRVQIGELTLDPKEEYGDTANGGEVKFFLDKIFVANVKNKSKVIAENTSGIVEYPTENNKSFWLCGDYADITGALKDVEASKIEWLGYDFESYDRFEDTSSKDARDQLFVDFPFVNYFDAGISGKTDNRRETELHKPFQEGFPSTIRHDGAGYYPVGMFFYVYENNQLSSEANNHTLLIIKGDYYYKKDAKSKWVKVNDCFYTVAINENGSYIYDDDKHPIYDVDHKYIKRNHQYILELNIKGPGNDSAYDKKQSANISANVKVLPWDVVVMNEEVE